MEEADVRRKIYRIFYKDLGLFPITQTDLNAPYDISTVNKLLGKLIGTTKKYPHIKGTVFSLKNVLGKAVARPPKGRPDILVMNPIGRGYVVEVKTLRPYENSFPFSRIEEKQRKWLNTWRDARGVGFIGLGVIREHGQVDRLDYLYLIPWEVWEDMERVISEYQVSIPLEAGPGYKVELQEQELDILHLFEEYRIERKDSRWKLSPPLRKILHRSKE